MNFLLTLGVTYSHHDHRREEGCFETARLALLDWEKRSIVQSVDYAPPREHRPDIPNDNVIFKGAALLGNRLFATTNTDIAEFRSPDLKFVRSYSHPWFNDNHFVAPQEDRLWVVVTGLDLVLELTYAMEVIAEHNVAEAPTWERFDRNRDYRKVVSTKPHAVHPNCLFFLEGEPWVTRFHQKDAVSLVDRSRRIPIEVGNPHDGHAVGDRVCFTTTNGRIVIANARKRRVEQVIDLNALSGKDRYLGWCRGVEIVGVEAFVAFSMLRTTKWREMASWVKNLGKAPLPTRIARYDLDREKLIEEVVLEEDRKCAVFTVRLL